MFVFKYKGTICSTCTCTVREPSVVEKRSGKIYKVRGIEEDAMTQKDATTSIRLKVRINRFHGVAAWSWNANDDVCGICQTAFEGTALGVKYPGEDCPVVWGKCGHAFHLQCVSKWLSQPSSKSSCPICRQEWEFGQNPINSNSQDE
jgi:anaphase-promoting complex subunit 11